MLLTQVGEGGLIGWSKGLIAAGYSHRASKISFFKFGSYTRRQSLQWIFYRFESYRM
jgi:hypothetical protein